MPAWRYGQLMLEAGRCRIPSKVVGEYVWMNESVVPSGASSMACSCGCVVSSPKHQNPVPPMIQKIDLQLKADHQHLVKHSPPMK